jgi:hypothetical protein
MTKMVPNVANALFRECIYPSAGKGSRGFDGTQPFRLTSQIKPACNGSDMRENDLHCPLCKADLVASPPGVKTAPSSITLLVCPRCGHIEARRVRLRSDYEV